MKNTISLYLFTILLTGSLILTGCDNPAGNDDDHEHHEPFGVALIMNGVEIATQENGVVSYFEGDHLELEVGEETNLVSVRFINEDGERFIPDENDGYSLRWDIGNEEVLEIEQHEEDGPWSFHLVGHGAGETTLNIILWHIDHADFTSMEFEVHVEEVVSSMEIQNEAGETVVTTDGSDVTGGFTVSAGETTGEFTALFYDDEGDVVELNSEYELDWHVHGSEYASVDPVEGKPYSFTVTGIEQGEAEVHFSLVKHDEDDDHDHDHEGAVFETPEITITVN